MKKNSPQYEDGYVKIANELYDVLLATNLNGTELKIIFCIIRKTYGYNKKRDKISISQFLDTTNLDNRNFRRSIKKLINMKIIIQIPGDDGNTYEFNKHYDEWIVRKVNNDVNLGDKKEAGDLGHFTPGQLAHPGHLTPGSFDPGGLIDPG
jgi:phage replication O-like protein O